ncbi:glycosyltransferase [Pseudomonas aeruginosa]|nr:glycosyltransferase [Pseudomonas aeruginosa]MDH4524249.1 glycosyltransferase [Pseudomonas aeruginosa]MDH4544452.1 glycosyltransferase [Pseudomonas aeruginosa]MDH4893523.1 glycosyltransferase [Pseudomonas aeruginosa]
MIEEATSSKHSDTTDAPLVSVVAPCFNAEKYLEEALRSIYEQDYPNFEVIIVDDGSTDNSYAMLEQLQKVHGFQLYRQQNQGVSAALNFGLRHARDATSLPPEALDWSAEPLSVRGLRVGLQLDPGCGMQPDAEIRAAIEAAARLFEEHGAQLRIVEPLMDRSLLDGLNDFWRARLWSELLLLDETRRARVLPYVHAWAEGGARVSGVDAVRGFNQTFEMRRRAARLFGEIDLLLTPTNQVEAFPADWASPLNDPQRPFEHIVFTVPWNMGEQPALSINCGFTAAGMPIGLQLVAPRFADTWLLRIGKTYEGWRGPIHGWPRPPAD